MKNTSLAIFDLDNTLIGGDSDHLWGEFLVEQGLVDGNLYRRENNRFYAEYRQGTLDIMAFLNFSLAPLAEHSGEELTALRTQYLEEKIQPILLPTAQQLLEKHRQAGDRLLIITATNSFITRPIADLLQVHDLIATEPEIINQQYTGKVSGTPCFQTGKVSRLNSWLAAEGMSLVNSSFYSDSHNDLPLLERVDKPVAVDPDEKLAQIAGKHRWPVISLR